jgi:predicted amino acid racemase
MPELHIDVDAIAGNAEAVAALLREHGLSLVGVTKGCLGEPRVAAAMLAGGAVALADTRDRNLVRLRTALPRAELHRIHLPSVAEPFEPGDVTYVSCREGAAAVAALGSPAVPRKVMVHVESGDEREGVPIDALLDLAAAISGEPRLRLVGVSANYACFRGRPEGINGSVETIARAAAALRAAGLPVDRVSGGNSSLLWLLKQGQTLPAEVTELRCGEALLLGQDALYYEPLPGCRTDACVLRAEVLEEYTRSAPGGSARRLVLGVGRQDLSSGEVRFTQPGFREIGRSADYLVVEAAAACARVRAGTMMDMIPAYEALVAAWTSPYVELRLLRRPVTTEDTY